jgi:hypothetical protein
MNNTYRIPEENMAKLAAAFAALARRAEKLSVPAPTFTEVTTETMIKWRHTTFVSPNSSSPACQWVLAGTTPEGTWVNTGLVRLIHVVEVRGETPKLDGWSLMAVIEHLPGEENILRKVPTVTDDLPEEFRVAVNSCDHCHTMRQRKETFVVRHDNGSWKRVGRGCLTDFLGGTSPEAIVSGATIIFKAAALCGECEEINFDERADGYHVYSFVTMAVACIRTHGWVSRKVAHEQGRVATADDALCEMDRIDDNTAHRNVVPNDDDVAFAMAAINWAGELRNDGRELNDYEHNLTVVANYAFVNRKHAGLAASIPVAYKHHLSRLEERQQLSTSEYVGEIRKRQDFTVTVTKAIDCASDYGPKTLYIMADAAGNLLKWFSSGTARLEIGTTYTLKATVKGHSEYRGVKYTQIARAVVAVTA